MCNWKAKGGGRCRGGDGRITLNIFGGTDKNNARTGNSDHLFYRCHDH